jgi:hypothetical protein
LFDVTLYIPLPILLKEVGYTLDVPLSEKSKSTGWSISIFSNVLPKISTALPVGLTNNNFKDPKSPEDIFNFVIWNVTSSIFGLLPGHSTQPSVPYGYCDGIPP